MDDIDRNIINTLQKGFPICEAPYLKIAITLHITETELLDRLKNLLANGTLTRFGPLYNAEQLGGGLTLAAVKAPNDRFDEIAGIINAYPEVAHNYARNHELNIWFVIATETPEHVEKTIRAIAQQTGLTVYNMPKLKEYFVNLQLEA
ncbi:MAG: AsnC family transcriptional regulator [Methylovulum sp.]|nr:AsnC family transcriptional regulator [Methylovulum sp.]